jgi:hypothetical protein
VRIAVYAVQQATIVTVEIRLLGEVFSQRGNPEALAQGEALVSNKPLSLRGPASFDLAEDALRRQR